MDGLENGLDIDNILSGNCRGSVQPWYPHP